MRATYRHTNLVARDWRALARFYQDVFGCVPVGPERRLSGPWIARGTGVADAEVSGIHLRLPGAGEDGPTLEIFTYARSASNLEPTANREGWGHLAFEVDDVGEARDRVVVNGGRSVGEIATATIPGVGLLTFVYVADPEGNILELQAWG